MEDLSISEIKQAECMHEIPVYDYARGEISCGNCGFVLSERMIDGRRQFFKGNATDRKIPFLGRQKIRRLRRRVIRYAVYPPDHRNVLRAKAELDRISGRAHISQHIREEALFIYHKALSKDLVEGRSIRTMVAAALYAACRVCGVPRAPREISKASLVKEKTLNRCYRLLVTNLDMQIPISGPVTYISRIAEKTAISGNTQGLAVRILKEGRNKRAIAGKNPMGLAAAALYIACLQNAEKKTQKDIAKAAGVTEVTVRNRYRALKGQLDLELLH